MAYSAIEARSPVRGTAPQTHRARWAVASKSVDPATARKLLAQLAAAAETPGARLRVAVVTAEIMGIKEGRALLHDVAPPTHETVVAIEAAWRGKEVDAAVRARIERRHGWVGRLAFVIGRRDEEPERAAVLNAARRTVITSSVQTLGFLALLVAGIVLLVIAFVRLSRGRLWTRAVPAGPSPAPRDVVWLETVNLFLAGSIVAAAIGHPAAILLAILPLLWPFARGVRWREWRDRLGLRGTGRDAPAGIVGHVAGLPLFVLAGLVTVWLAGPGGASHPAFDNAGEHTPWLLMFLLAVVVAPLVEELVFRGALYGFLRPRFRIVGSAVISGVAFAAVHPQGWAAIPVLGVLGAWLALLREWRQSIYAPIAAHAAHNGILVGMTYLTVG